MSEQNHSSPESSDNEPPHNDSDAELSHRRLLEAALLRTRAMATPPKHSGSQTNEPPPDNTHLPEPEKPRYEKGLPIAKGGMGEVLEAREIPVGRRVAMKVIHDDQRRDAEIRARFIEEAQITGQLEHPSIVPMHDLSVDDRGNVFYTMKRVEGQTLGSILFQLRTGDPTTLAAYPLSRLLTVFQKICDAIAFAHSRGVIHRDLKPDNVMVGQFGEVLVMDWGIAKVLNLPDLEITIQDHLAEADDEPLPRTLHGTVMGIPGYLPPEQAEGKRDEMGIHSDIYSLGAVLYEILTLKKSIEATSLEDALDRTIGGDIVPPLKRKDANTKHCPGNRIPQSLDAVTMRAMATKPTDRYETVEQLQREIEAYQSGFATEAEEAGFWKHLGLFIRRHRVESTAAMLIGLVVTGSALFLAKAWRDAERQQVIAEKSQESEREQRLRAESSEASERKQRIEAESQRAKYARQVMNDWVEKGDLQAEKRFPNRALLRYAEAFKVGHENNILTEEEESVHRFRLGQFLGIAPRLEKYGRTNLALWGIYDHGDSRAIIPGENEIVILSTEDWSVIRKISLQSGPFPVRTIEAAPGNQIVVQSDKNVRSIMVIRVSETGTQDKIMELRHDSGVIDATGDQSRNQIVTLEQSGHLNRWCSDQGSIIDRLRITQSNITSGYAKVSPDGNHCAVMFWTEEKRRIACMVSLSQDFRSRPLEIFNFQDGGRGLVTTRNVITFSNNGNEVAFGFGNFKDGCVFSVSDGKPVPQSTPHRVEGVYFSPIKEQLVTRWTSGNIMVEDSLKGKFAPARPIDSELNASIYLFHFHQDGSRVAFADGAEETARFYHFPSRRPFPCVVSSRYYPSGMFLANGEQVIVQDRAFRIPRRGTGPRVIHEKSGGRAIQFSANGRKIFVRDAESDSRTSILADIGNPSANQPLSVFPPNRSGPSLAASSCEKESGRWWFAAGHSWHVQNVDGSFTSIPLDEKHFISAVQPHGKLLVTGKESEPSKRQVWRFPEGEMVKEMEGFIDPRVQALPAPNNRYILFGGKVNWGSSTPLGLFDLKTGEIRKIPIQTHHFHYSPTMKKAAFSADSSLLLARNELFSIDDGVPHHLGILTTKRVQEHGSCAISPLGNCCAIVDQEWRVRLFSIPDLNPLGAPLSHPDQVNSLSFSPDGQWLASGCQDGKIRVWDANSGTLVASPLDTGERDKRIEFIQINREGTHLLTRVQGGGAYLWDFSPPTSANPEHIVTAAQVLSRNRVTDGRVLHFLDPEWVEMIRNSPREAQRLYLSDEFYTREFGDPVGR